MMRGIVLISIFTITCAFNVNAQVINYAIDPSFNSGLLFNRGAVSDILHTEIGTYMIMGSFFGLESPLEAGAMITSSGNLYNPQSIGGLKVATYKFEFLQYGQGIRRFNIPGGTNPAFRFEFQKQAYNGPLSNVALDAKVMPDDHILVAGRFFTDSTLMGTNESHLGLRQLCMIDSTGAPVEDFPMIRCEWPTNSVIHTVNRMSTGEYIIAGSFNEVDGHPYAKLAKLNADFTVNTDFEPVFAAGPEGVFTQLIDSQDRIWVIFGSLIELLDDPDYPGRILRLLPDGTIDDTFTNVPVFTAYTAGTYENPSTPNPIAAGVIEDADGTFIVFGDFIEINGEEHRRLAKIDDTGLVIQGAFESTTPDSSVWGAWDGVFGPVMSAGIRKILKLPDGKLLIGGQFSSFGGEPYSCLVRLEPNGFVGVNDLEGRGKLKIWPNPSGGTFQVSLPDANERIERVEIYDLQGRTIAHTSHLEDGQACIEIHSLASGIYLIKAGSSKGVYTQKLVVE